MATMIFTDTLLLLGGLALVICFFLCIVLVIKLVFCNGKSGKSSESSKTIKRRTKRHNFIVILDRFMDMKSKTSSECSKNETAARDHVPNFVDNNTNNNKTVAKFECRVLTSSKLLGIYWIKDTVVVSDPYQQNSTGYALNILNAKVSDSGTYFCKVTNQYGTASTKTYLSVLERGNSTSDKFMPFENDSLCALKATYTQAKISINEKPSRPWFTKHLPIFIEVSQGSDIQLLCVVNTP